MIFRSVTLKECSVRDFKLKRVTLHVVATYKYFGNYISDDLSDDDGINRQYGTLYVQGNNYNAKIEYVLPRGKTHTVSFIFLTYVM